MTQRHFTQFQRSTLLIWIDLGVALVWFYIAYSYLRLGHPQLTTGSALLAIIYAAEATWMTCTPYARIDDQGIRVRERLLGWWRYVAWSEVVETETHRSKVRLVRNGSAFTVRLSWVRDNQREDLIAAIQYHTMSQSPGPPNHGFNRTPESSGPAKPGEFGGGAG
jgi:hypothetical protein